MNARHPVSDFMQDRAGRIGAGLSWQPCCRFHSLTLSVRSSMACVYFCPACLLVDLKRKLSILGFSLDDLPNIDMILDAAGKADHRVLRLGYERRNEP